jgi:hypothetical protein
MKLEILPIFLSFLMLTSCTTSLKVIESDFQKLRTQKTGALLTVNLETNGRVRQDKECFLKINDGRSEFKLIIERGVQDYALPILNTGRPVEITTISCGPFYFYDLKNQGAVFTIRDQEIKYLGFVNFSLQEKGKLEWGHETNNQAQLLQRTQSMGLESDSLEVDLLKL